MMGAGAVKWIVGGRECEERERKDRLDRKNGYKNI
jgi:hypothetical protein